MGSFGSKQEGGFMKKLFIFVVVFFMLTIAAKGNALDDTVHQLAEIGLVQKVGLDSVSSLRVWVRPVFHDLDFDQKHRIARIFSDWSKQKYPEADHEYLYFVDSRNNKTVGTYYSRYNRLKLARGYR
jgi:hypothetical protein